MHVCIHVVLRANVSVHVTGIGNGQERSFQ